MSPRWIPGQAWVWIQSAYPPIEYEGRTFLAKYRKAKPNPDGVEDGLTFLVYATEFDTKDDELTCLRLEWINGAYKCVGIVPRERTR
jgi:hypothetical protein